MSAILSKYNSKLSGGAAYNEQKLEECFNNSVHLLRFATDYIYHKSYLLDEDLDKLTGFFIVAHGADKSKHTNLNILQNLACQTGRHSVNTSKNLAANSITSNNSDFINTSMVTQLVENNNYEHSLRDMLECISPTDYTKLTNNRKNLRIYNILDANIVPINFHALQREVPLINMINYSYTFDRMVCKFLGVSDEKTWEKIIHPFDSTPTYQYPSSKNEMLARILVNPLGFRDMTDLNTIRFIRDLMVGHDTSNPANTMKPKYLSDQLWGKLLLKSIDGNHDSKTSTKPVKYIDMTSPKGRPKLGATRPATYITVSEMSGMNHRYGTVVVRYIEWFVHIQRLMRMMMREQLEWIDDPVVHRSEMLATEITEFEHSNGLDPDAFY